jgi:hypothetical protein
VGLWRCLQVELEHFDVDGQRPRIRRPHARAEQTFDGGLYEFARIGNPAVHAVEGHLALGHAHDELATQMARRGHAQVASDRWPR